MSSVLSRQSSPLISPHKLFAYITNKFTILQIVFQKLQATNTYSADKKKTERDRKRKKGSVQSMLFLFCSKNSAGLNENNLKLKNTNLWTICLAQPLYKCARSVQKSQNMKSWIQTVFKNTDQSSLCDRQTKNQRASVNINNRYVRIHDTGDNEIYIWQVSSCRKTLQPLAIKMPVCSLVFQRLSLQ